jgi:hypothetical protein
MSVSRGDWWCGVLVVMVVVLGRGGRRATATPTGHSEMRRVGTAGQCPVVSCLVLRSRVWCRIEGFELPPAGGAGHPAPAVSSGGVGLLVADGLVGHRRPGKASELARDGDGRDGGALAVGGEVAVAVMQADLRVPGSRGDHRRDMAGERGQPPGAPRWMLVVPGGLDQQPAGVAVAGLGEVPAPWLNHIRQSTSSANCRSFESPIVWEPARRLRQGVWDRSQASASVGRSSMLA